VTLNIWEAKGLQENYYYAYGDNYIPYEIDQQPNYIQWFDVTTYQQTIVDPSIFNLPTPQCDVSCSHLSVCGVAKLSTFLKKNA